MILNLALNAMEAMQRSRRQSRRQLTIRSARASDKEAEVSVTDSGLGIPEELLAAHLRALRDVQVNRHGSGARDIAARSSRRTVAEIRAENLPGGGAVFRFTLPFARDAAR